MTIQPATLDDIPELVRLIEAYRLRLADWRPVFWKKAAASDEMTALWFAHLMKQEHVLTLISEQNGVADGFLMAILIDAPPVYDPGGKACMIDDFVVADDTLWAATGAELLQAARTWARQQGAAQVVVVSPTDHARKNDFIEAEDLVETTKWWVQKP